MFRKIYFIIKRAYVRSIQWTQNGNFNYYYLGPINKKGPQSQRIGG